MTDEEKREMLVNEMRDVLLLVTDKVKINDIETDDYLARFEVKVQAPTYYLTSRTDNNPKPTNEIIFYVDIPDNYPVDGPHVYYSPDKYLASINVYGSGTQCIDTWRFNPEHAGANTTLVGTIRKTVMDIIHDPSVSRYDSMANSKLADWQREKTASGELPTCRLSELLKTEEELALPKLPASSLTIAGTRTRPALPGGTTTTGTRTRPALPGGTTTTAATRTRPALPGGTTTGAATRTRPALPGGTTTAAATRVRPALPGKSTAVKSTRVRPAGSTSSAAARVTPALPKR